MRCKDCKWWLGERYCESPKIHTDGETGLDACADDEAVAGGNEGDFGFSDYFATGPNFGCTGFTPKDGEA